MTTKYLAAPPGFTDHTFTSTSGVQLSVRVWPADPPVPSRAPFISLTHGGGLLAGQHFMPPPWPFPGFRARGYHVVSHSYRLGPQARVDEQLADCLEAIAWCRTNLPSILGPDKVDVDRYALYGDSAGGLLVTLMGLRLTDPPPRAIVNVYGVVDFSAMLALDPLAPSNREPEQWNGEFGEEELERFLEDRDPANILTASTAWREIEEYSDVELSRRWVTNFRYTIRIRLQAELHIWRSLHPRGISLLKTATMHPEKFDDETEFQAFVNSMSPLLVLRQRRAEGRTEYPPTAFLHGTSDTSVPVQQSYDMANTLREMGVPVIERYEEGEEHVFDHKYTSEEVEGWETSIQPIVDFVNHWVGH